MFARCIAVLSIFVFTVGCGSGSMRSELQNQPYTKPAYQSPNYHPYATPSHAYRIAGNVHVGGDVEPREKLRNIGTSGGINISMGASRDGASVGRLKNYIHDLETRNDSTILSLDGFYPFRVKPKLWFDQRLSSLANRGDPHAIATLSIVGDSIRILNDALPPEFQIELASADKGDRPYHEGALTVKYMAPADIARGCGDGGTAIACSTISGYRFYPIQHIRQSDIWLPDNLNVSRYNEARFIVIHELLHALGIRGHVDSIEFPDSIVGTYGDFFPNPGFVLHRIDREALQVMYMSQRTDNYNDLGEWTDTTLHLVGESDDGNVNFGVALFNGLPQPWARGILPDRILGLDPESGRMERPYYLFGSVTWRGALLGFSGISPVVGDATLKVDMRNLNGEQVLDFNDIYFLNRSEDDSDAKWFPHRDIKYKVNMGTNGFHYSEPDGQIRGVFTGPEHEGMAGTLKRTDLVGAFGGKR